MNPIFYLLLLFFLLLLHCFITSHATILMQTQTCTSPITVEDACRGAVDGHPGAVAYDYCVSSLNSDPRSRSADLHGLAVLATKMAIDHVASTESKIDELMDLEATPTIKGGFNACLEVYSDAVDRLRDALDNLNSRLYAKAVELLAKALRASEDCQEVFRGAEAAPPVMVEDRDYGKLASIALGIAASVE
ncbi:putative invertase inhibitor [Typha latifolia]|uniref:putative invertase inhibitor n=1 Tax=Typha latifolia TaxID=4733 RepID=UPI003C2BBAE9